MAIDETEFHVDLLCFGLSARVPRQRQSARSRLRRPQSRKLLTA